MYFLIPWSSCVYLRINLQLHLIFLLAQKLFCKICNISCIHNFYLHTPQGLRSCEGQGLSPKVFTSSCNPASCITSTDNQPHLGHSCTLSHVLGLTSSFKCTDLCCNRNKVLEHTWSLSLLCEVPALSQQSYSLSRCAIPAHWLTTHRRHHLQQQYHHTLPKATKTRVESGSMLGSHTREQPQRARNTERHNASINNSFRIVQTSAYRKQWKQN